MTTENFDQERLARRVAFGLASFSSVVQGWARGMQSALSEIDRLREMLISEGERLQEAFTASIDNKEDKT